MAAANAMTAERRSAGPVSRSPSEIRFSDVAHYVGLSLVRDPSKFRSTPSQRPRVAPAVPRSPDSAGCPKTQLQGERGSDGELSPVQSVHVGRVERLHCQLEWLKAEQRAEKEQLRRLESCLSDSMLLEKRAQRRAAKHREMRDFHMNRTNEVDSKIQKLREELQVRQKTNKGHDPLSSPPGGQGCTSFPLQHEATRQAQLVQPANAWNLPQGPEAEAQAEYMYELTAATRRRERWPNASGSKDSSGAPFNKVDSGHPGRVSSQLDSDPMPSEDEDASDEEPYPPSQSGHLTLKDVVDSAAETARQPRSLPSVPGTPLVGGAAKAEMSEVLHESPSLNFTDSEWSDAAEAKRENIRREMISVAGDERAAFRALDLNNSGNISLQEFADGVARLGVKWTELTGLKRPRDLFKLFDQDKDGVINFRELFPQAEPRELKRMNTPEFIGYWIRKNRDFENLTTRCAKWQPKGPEDRVEGLIEAAQFRDEVAAKKKWMSSTIRRLKTRGKSDARCREVVALHLPRGTGPKDREDVSIFSQAEVRACKKAYTDGYMEPVKRIQKVVVEMKEQKRDVRNVREELYMVTEAKLMQQRVEEDRKNLATSIGGIGLLAKVKDPLVEDEGKAAAPPTPAKPAAKSFKRIAEENGMEEDAVTDLYREYQKFADSSEKLGRKAFTRLLQVLCPARTLADSDLEAWWGQLTRSQQDAPFKGSRRNQCKFEEFIIWFSTSEARTA